MAEGENAAVEPQDSEAEPEGAPSAGFVFTSFREFLKFVEYVGDAVPIELAAPIHDTAGTVLIQKSLHIRANVITNLWKFFNQGNLNENITVSRTKGLRNALREKICKGLLKCLEPGRFHVAQALSDASVVNIRAVLTHILERPDVLPLFLKLDQMEDPILPHLGEVALVAGGFAEQFLQTSTDGQAAREIIRTAIFAGLLHDIALADDDDFLLKDIEGIKESRHAELSAKVAKTLLPDLSVKITDIIEHHHRDANPYDPNGDSVLAAQSVAAEALALAEYIFVQLRSQYRKDDTMNSAELLFYELGRAFGQGKFHPQFRKITAQLWEKLYATLSYGYEIGLVESSCPHKHSAIAYPTPRCTQIMCHKDVQTCGHYDPHFPLEILQGMHFPGRPGVMITPGKYAKCKLAARLPQGIEGQKGAVKWMEKGATKKPESSG